MDEISAPTIADLCLGERDASSSAIDAVDERGTMPVRVALPVCRDMVVAGASGKGSSGKGC